TAQFRRLIFSTTGEILEHGRKTRTFPPQAKQALLVKARGRCQYPGCDAPITWLEADHLTPWNQNGPTNTTNGQILCSRHNKLKNDTPPNDPGP
ncbi:MAG: HNH endonuclease, partial [Actinomycetia bacterium]|nr:HNH endonuclease [Actinomycetes bacterium]